MTVFLEQAIHLIRHPLLLITLALVLLLYEKLSRRPETRLPRIPFGFFILFLIFTGLAPYMAQVGWEGLNRFFDVGALIALYFGIIRVIAFFVVDYIIGTRKAIAVPAITRDVILVVLYVIIIMIVLRQKLNIDIASLVATSAVLTAIIGLALQDTLGNLFSGLALNVEKPYKLGDWVTFDKYRGQVRGMSWRSTTLLTPENETIVIPNNVISKSHIVNYSDPSTFIVSGFFLGVEYSATPSRVRDVVLATLKSHPEILQHRELEVRLADFGEYAIKYEVRYWIDIRDDYERSERIRAEVMGRLWYSLRRAGIRIPFPTRVQYQARVPDKTEVVARIAEVLARIDLFASIPSEEQVLLAKAIAVVEFAEGEEVVCQDNPGDSMYIIDQGICEIFVKGPTGRRIGIATLNKQGDFFGEMSLMTGAKRSATVAAKTDVILYEIAKEDMLLLLEKNPAISTTISELLAKRLEERTSALAHADVSEVFVKPPTAGQILQKIKAFFYLT